MTSKGFIKSNLFRVILLSLVSLLLYGWVAYGISRHEHLKLGLCVGGLFLAYYGFLKINFTTQWLFGLALLFRLVFLVSLPSLSQDFYRFIWDGELILKGLNPYLFTPNQLIDSWSFVSPKMKLLWEGMGALSQSHFSNYPPIHQMPSVFAVILSKSSLLGNVIVLRLLLILVDIGVIYFGLILLKLLHLPVKNILLYAFNPLVIIELCGNLHHEGLMILLFILGLIYLIQNKSIISGVFIGLSILTKLIPMLGLPLLIFSLKRQQTARFLAIVIAVIFVGFWPFWSASFSTNYMETIGLWFNNFEFNASVFYVFKSLGQLFGIKIMPYMQLISALILGLMMIYIFFKNERSLLKVITQMLWLLSVYYLISTTVHPWYITTLVGLCVFTKYRFPIYWSAMLFVSYFFYHQNAVVEHNLWRFLEYGIVFVVMFYEGIKYYKTPTTSSID